MAPSPNPYISEMAFSCRFQKVYTYPPPKVTTCLHMEAKLVEIAEKCQNPESWHIMNVPERYAFLELVKAQTYRRNMCQHQTRRHPLR